MKSQILTVLFLSSLLPASSQSTINALKTNESLVDQLRVAEKTKNTDQLRSLFSAHAVIYYPGEVPFVGIDAIVSLYEFMWKNKGLETLDYIIEGVENNLDNHIEFGKYIYSENNAIKDTIEFKAIFKKENSAFLIEKLIYGNAKIVLQKLLEPTGEFQIGSATYFYDKRETKNSRMTAFQIWYPAVRQNEEFGNYQSIETVKASSSFLGLPYFFLSYTAVVESNSYRNAAVVKNKKFPVLIYNHGYSGFTSVYQTVFEELASHGYIVVSIGHENESSLLIIDDKTIIKTDPQNIFYSSRASELGGQEINSIQNIILNSDDLEENKKAYEQLVEKSPLHNESTRIWASDTKIVMDKLKILNKEDKKLRGAFDFEAIGIFGHSVGGATAGQLGFEDNGIKAGINLDGFQFGDLINHRLKIPFMFVSSNQNGNSYLRAASFMNNSEADCFLAVIKGFSHGSFTDLEFFNQGGKEAIQLQRDLILAFFNQYLKNNDFSLNAVDSKYSKIKINKNN